MDVEGNVRTTAGGDSSFTSVFDLTAPSTLYITGSVYRSAHLAYAGWSSFPTPQTI